MSLELLRYPSYAFAILLLIGMALLILLFFIHWIVPKDMLRTYFREPYFSSTEVAFFSSSPFFFMRTVMFMRIAAWPGSGKRRGLTDAYQLAPRWFQVTSKAFLLVFFISFIPLITLVPILLVGFCYFDHY